MWWAQVHCPSEAVIRAGQSSVWKKRLETSCLFRTKASNFLSRQMRCMGSNGKSSVLGGGRTGHKPSASTCCWGSLGQSPPLLASKAMLRAQWHSDRVNRALQTAECCAYGHGPQVPSVSSRKPSLAVPADAHTRAPLSDQARSASVLPVLFLTALPVGYQSPAAEHLSCPFTHLPIVYLAPLTTLITGEKLGTVAVQKLSD